MPNHIAVTVDLVDSPGGGGQPQLRIQAVPEVLLSSRAPPPSEEPPPSEAPPPSGAPPSRPKNLPRLPNNTDLVFNQNNSEVWCENQVLWEYQTFFVFFSHASLFQLLSALLPALNKYSCLTFTTQKSRRSPWVRAFCDLYHPAGPWGRNKFSNAPDITSKRKYAFKGYQVPTLHEKLKKYEGDNTTHLELKAALDEYFGKEVWRKEFLKACEQIAEVEVNKPSAERAAIPTLEKGVVVTATEVVTAEATVSTGAPDAQQQTKRKATEEEPPSRPNTRARKKADSENKLEEEVVPEGELTPAAVSPEPRAKKEGGQHLKDTLERKRDELCKLLASRSKAIPSGGRDALSDKIQSKIDEMDENMLELILT